MKTNTKYQIYVNFVYRNLPQSEKKIDNSILSKSQRFEQHLNDKIKLKMSLKDNDFPTGMWNYISVYRDILKYLTILI